jgi:hypothetical protein
MATARGVRNVRCRGLQQDRVPHVTTTRSEPGSSCMRYAHRRAVVRLPRTQNTPTPSPLVGPVHGQQARTPPLRSTWDRNRSYVDTAHPGNAYGRHRGGRVLDMARRRGR